MLRKVSIPPLREHLLRQMKVTKAKALSTRHSCVATRVRPVIAMPWTSRTHAAISSPLASLRIGAEVWMECSRSERRIALGPRGGRRGAQGFGAARDSALRLPTSRRLSERRERSEHSEFGARPQTPSTAEQSALGGPPPSGSPFLGYFFWRSKRSNSPAGATSRQQPHAVRRSKDNPLINTPPANESTATGTAQS